MVAKENSARYDTQIAAGLLQKSDDGLLLFKNDVSLSRHQQNLTADQLILDENNNQFRASGNVGFADQQYSLKSQSATINNQNEKAEFSGLQFNFPERHINGSAEQLFKLSQSQSAFSQLLYTSCDPMADPDDLDWHLTSDYLHIDDETGRGTAKNTWIHFKGVPFLYLPYFMFPIDDRRMSGILAPTFSFSESRGTQLAVPVYLNLAPNYDDTITPVWYSRRGLQLNNEFRYLSLNHSGQIDLSYLDDDEVDDSRWYQQWKHDWSISESTTADIHWQEVSDEDYFDDFNLFSKTDSEARHLSRRVALTQSAEKWRASIFWQDYQTPDPDIAISSRPYQRLPAITLQSQFDRFDNELEFQTDAEWVMFERDESITGNRTHISPVLSWPASDSWYFFTPQLELALTDYQLDNNDPESNSIQRSIPVFSLDSGLIFERDVNYGDWQQTLEPRIFLAHIPFEDQSDIPDFDTSLRSESYNNLFQANRFSGNDRIGDTSQLTFGLGTRFYQTDSGRELFYARIAQAFYQRDRRVSLNNTVDERRESNIIARIDANPWTPVTIRSEVTYDQQEKEITDREFAISIRKNGLVANIEHYFDDEVLEQSIVSLVYPINDRWTVFAKSHRSILFNRPVEKLLGLAYESCCWGLKILASQTSDEDEDFAVLDEAIYFQLTLKGLSQAGRDIDAEIAESIPGYKPVF